ncbi:long-chain fatty acid--CoA ligase [Betaproteobacteria bacterium UKL13-2]|nr:long-chain fatty acid--CoA ligase [Betaproteobacteria bacterium UKL13-2]HCG53362.1 long-chain-fatty-acid--CoA ligase [Betaproteobacteria bacterium]
MNAAVSSKHDRPWLNEYPEGVPADIDPDAYASLKDVLNTACQRYDTQSAFTCMGKTLTFRDVDRLSRHFAAYLQNKLSLTRGDRVAVMMPNILQYPVAIFAILRAGYVVVNCNPLYTTRELEHQLKDSGAKAIVVIENFATTLEQCIQHTGVKHVITTQLGDLLGFPKSLLVNWVIKHRKKMVPAWNIPGAVSFKQVLAEGEALSYTKPEIAGSDIAFLQYTGGTTGVSKGAILTHRNLVANIQQVGCWTGLSLKDGEEVIIQPLPMYHIFALNTSINFMSRGAETVLIPNPRDMDGFIKELKSRRWNVLTGVNTLFNGLLHHPEFKNVDFSGLKLALGGGMAVQRAVAEKWKSVTGKTLIEAYGLTETSPGATGNPLSLAEFNGCIGLPFPSTIVTIRDDDENILGVGEVGEICIEGPQVMQGYWQRPDESAKVFCKDGAFKSGDIGLMDERGYFKIVDRKKDMILVSGFNVYPNEIEDVVAMCPGVLEVCAVSMPDEKSTEAVRVVVVKSDPNLTKETIMAFCKERLTGYKMPRQIEFWSELPKTNVGKVLRRTVRDTAPVK